jgi:hypothetical protein
MTLRSLAILAVISGVVLVVGFIGWIVARVHGSLDVGLVFGKILLYDMYVILGLGAYVAFVGAWHTWERITGRMELQSDRERKE